MLYIVGADTRSSRLTACPMVVDPFIALFVANFDFVRGMHFLFGTIPKIRIAEQQFRERCKMCFGINGTNGINGHTKG